MAARKKLVCRIPFNMLMHMHSSATVLDLATPTVAIKLQLFSFFVEFMGNNGSELFCKSGLDCLICPETANIHSAAGTEVQIQVDITVEDMACAATQ
mmetsp:Transcript_1187/g.3062  ORF Transcript_1187/g.3062 Transcript_1187/m.3062 type:complete len:97 (+) Transcript_1187:41-331(+)